MDLTINLATPAACGLIARLHDSCFEDTWAAKFIAALLQTPGVRALVARSSEEEVGFAIIRVAADEAELLALGVTPRAQRQGAGRALLAHAMQLAFEMGARVMHLEVAVSNTAGQALYESAAFERTGVRERYYSTGEDALVFSRDLALAPVGE